MEALGHNATFHSHTKRISKVHLEEWAVFLMEAGQEQRFVQEWYIHAKKWDIRDERLPNKLQGLLSKL